MKRILTVGLMIYGLVAGIALADGDLAKNFATPPASARPWVYWFPLNGNLTKEGITADLEAMARVGIGGVLYMEVDQGAPKGSADFAGPLWREMIQHACKEANRLGIEINMNNDAGWCGSGGPWITPELSMQIVVWTETVVEGGKPFEGVLAKPLANKGFYQDIAVLAMPAPSDDKFRTKRFESKSALDITVFFDQSPANFPEAPQDALILRDKIVDVSSKMDAAGKLTWDPPPGKWLVTRFGHTTTGWGNQPAPESGRGLECDKFSKEAAAAHYNGLMGKIIADNKPLVGRGKVLVSTHIDSWEVGTQNWTPKMREEFKNRRGYDLWKFLPAFTGRVLDSAEVTERFLWDLRQTISDLIVENYAGEFRRMANKDGMRLSIEAYDRAPVNEMTYAGEADEPMGEFWKVGANTDRTCTEMVSAGHVYGKKIIGAEAFTSTDAEKWLQHPATIKELGDWAFCEGINRFVFHRYAAQPWTNVAPGMSMGPWGLHYERTQTWWEQSKAWHQYLARCQYLLQQGLFVADVLYLEAEGAGRQFSTPGGAEIASRMRGGYNYDGCPPEVVLTRLKVKDGRLVLPDGMSYRVLVMPDCETMTPRLLRKIRELVDAGATVIGGGIPPEKSSSLADMGAGDAEVKKLAAELWPKLVTGKNAAQLLGERGVKPDFSATPMLRYTHRTIGDADVYFVANPQPSDVAAVASFRVTGKQPELWWPATGRTAPALAFDEKDGVTRVPLSLEASGSLFVVFRKPADAAKQVVSITRDGKELLPLQAAATPQVPDVSKPFTMVAWVKPGADTALPDEAKSGVSSGQIQPNNYVVYPVPGHEVWSGPAAGAGLAVGRNGVTVVEHGGSHLAAVLVCPTPVTDWTHIAVVYRDGTPQLYLNGKLAHTGLKSVFAVHGSVGVSHTREIAPFKGKRAGLQQFDHALTDAEILKLAQVPLSLSMLDEPPAFDIATGEIRQSGTYVFTSATGQQRELKVALPALQEIAGPWQVSFDPKWGGPAKVTFEKLDDWSTRPEDGIKYYSGTAVYRTTFQAKKGQAYLDLGKVEVMADVTLNGKPLGTLWKPPYRVDVTEALKDGENKLELKVVNLLINRQIGDEQLPEDSERNDHRALNKWPEWLQEGKPSPTGRFTFGSWRLWKKDDPLVESGLLGPVTLRPVDRMNLKK
ncbi:MAG: glycosyl hydrolase [Verrucomicrobia bacterium]|nr:glycosyl hydrolase [Verrucomicrobiota bacterium]